jgi:outer membrane protein TolC
VLTAALEGVTAGERVLRDAQLRVRALVEPLTEALLVQRDLQAARASLLSALAAQAIEKVVLEQETGITGSE